MPKKAQKSGGGKGQQQAAPGGSKVVANKKGVSLAVDVEDEVKKLLQDLGDSGTAGGSGSNAGPQAGQAVGKKAAKQYGAVYDGLLNQGFTQQQIELVLRALPPGSVRLDAALDWLCLNLPPTQLPRALIGTAKSAARDAKVQVLALNKPGRGPAPTSSAPYDPAPDLPPYTSSSSEGEEETDGDSEGESEHNNTGSAARKAAAAADDDAAAAKAWIRQQYLSAQQESDAASEGEDEVSSASSIDDWELWADPREVERRKQERARARIPPEVRTRQVAHELVKTRAMAALAKQAGDKAKQQSAGAIIRQLKSEMDQLGLTEERAAQIVQEDTHAAAAARAADTDTHATFDPDALDLFGDTDTTPTQAPATQPTATTNTTQTPMTAPSKDVGEGDASSNGLGVAHGVDGSKDGLSKDAGKGGEGDNDDWMADFDIFGDSGGNGGIDNLDTAQGSAVSKPVAAAAAAEPLVPWGAEAAAGAGRRGAAAVGGKGKGAPAAPAVAEPRALLSQQCQKQGWPQPRFERLKDSVGGEHGDVCYSLTLNLGAPRGAAAKRAGWSGTRTFQLEPDDDGWATVKDAQNAVSTRALYELFSSTLPLHHQLGPPYKTLWIQWEAAGAASQRVSAQTQDDSRDTFVQSLLAELEQQQKQQTTDNTQGGGSQLDEEGAGDRGPGDADDDLAEEQQTPQQAEESHRLLTMLQDWWASSAGQAMRAARDKLPIRAVQEPLRAALAAHDVILVCGDTGCGKTTQVPQYLLEELTLAGQGSRAQIICTQPRRIAAMSVAYRVASERGEPSPGANPHSTVAYQVRLDSTVTQHSKLIFCTTGILMRRLAGDRDLSHVTHVIVDEVHERSMQGDFLLALLKALVPRRRAMGQPLKVVLMSATLDADTFSRYMGQCPVLTAEGRTFPVEPLYLEHVYETTGYRLAPDSPAAYRPTAARAAAHALRTHAGGGNRERAALLSSGWGDEEKDSGPLNPHYDSALYAHCSESVRRNLSRCNEEILDYDLMEELISHIHDMEPEGAILVFLPGVGEISQLYQRLSATRCFNRPGQGGAVIHVLHSGVSPEEQRAVFPRPPQGTRKIVLATNIAETSLTIEDVVYVVDTGRHKERRYDASRRMSLLVLEWVSRASALQRRGRAGRVRPGKCYCLYTQQRFEHQLRAYGAPEIVRVPLEELVLQIHALGLGPAGSFLSGVLEPPPPKSVTGALVTLSQVGALDMSEGGEQLTALGQHLANLPVDPRLGKLLVLGAVVGALAPAATIAATLSHKSPFHTPTAPDKRKEAERRRRTLADKGSGTVAAGQQSDHLLLLAAFNAWHTALTGDAAKPGGGHKASGASKAHTGQESGRKAAGKVATQLSLNEKTLQELQEMRIQLATLLVDAGLIPRSAITASHDTSAGSSRGQGQHRDGWLDDMSAPWNRYATNACVVKALLCAALAPNVAMMSEQSSPHLPPVWLTPVGVGSVTQIGQQTNTGQVSGAGPLEEVSLHPSCVAHGVRTPDMTQPFVVFLEKVKTGRAYLRDITPVSPVSLLLFGGPLTVLHTQGLVVVDGWIRVRAAAQTAVVVRGLRTALDNLLQNQFKYPGRPLSGAHASVIPTLVKLLQDDERPAGM